MYGAVAGGLGGGLAGMGGGLAGMGGMGLLYSTSFLHAGFIGLGALWLASYLGHGGWAGAGGHYPAYSSGAGYGEGYDEYGGNYESGGYGGYGPPDHYGRGDKKGYSHYDYKRKKRSLGADGDYLSRLQGSQGGEFTFGPPNAADGVYPENHQDAKNEEEHFVEVIQRSDSDSCSLRLVCELSAIRHRVLTKEEWDILQFVRYGDSLFNAAFPGQGVASGSKVLAPYKEAGLHGKRGGHCATRFRKCLYSASQIMEMVRTLKT